MMSNLLNDKPYKGKDSKPEKLPYLAKAISSIRGFPDFGPFHSELGRDGWSPGTPYRSYRKDGRIGDQAHNRLFVFSIVTGNEIYCYRIVNYSADHDSYCQKGEYENV